MLYTYTTVSKKAEKEQAIALRKRGFTLREIARYTNVSVSTLSLWFKEEPWSKRITEDNQKRARKENSKRISLLNTVRGNQYKKLYAEAERSAVTEFKHYKANPLFIAGLTLYLAHGDTKNERIIRMSSTKIEIQRIFIKFATEFLGVPREKLRFWLYISPLHDPKLVSMAWSQALKIPISQFHKYQVIHGKSTKRVLQYGVGNTIIGSAVLKRKLMKWIELMHKELK
jgi:transcriptional regulator with XRE-family HTH domain